MKTPAKAALAAALALLLLGCSHPLEAPPEAAPAPQETSVPGGKTAFPAGWEAICASYYEAKSSDAYPMIQKSIFQRLIDDWTDPSPTNPVLNYDSFTQYQVLNRGAASPDPDDAFYCCTFSADGGRCGCLAAAYHGDSLSKVCAVETPYLFDLAANAEQNAAGLSAAKLDFGSVTAHHVQLADAENNHSDEVVRFTDGEGRELLCIFADDAAHMQSFLVSSQL